MSVVEFDILYGENTSPRLMQVIVMIHAILE